MRRLENLMRELKEGEMTREKTLNMNETRGFDEEERAIQREQAVRQRSRAP
jgi:hypothetical protein